MSDVTESTEATVKLKRAKYNWTGIKKAWVSGESVVDIGVRYNLPASAIYSKASISGWPRRRDLLQAMPKPETPSLTAIARTTETLIPQIVAQQHNVISAEVRNRIKAWFDKTLKACNGLHEQLDRKTKRNLDVEEIKSLAGSLELIDRVARRTFGLDSPGSQGAGVAGLALVSQPWSGSAIIDVTPEPVARLEAPATQPDVAKETAP